MALSQKRLMLEEAISTQQTPIFKTFYVKRQLPEDGRAHKGSLVPPFHTAAAPCGSQAGFANPQPPLCDSEGEAVMT